MAKAGVQFGNPQIRIDRNVVTFGNSNSNQPSPGSGVGSPIGLLLALTKAA